MLRNLLLHQDGEDFWFSSLDGDTWLPVTRPGTPGDPDDETRLAHLFGVHRNEAGKECFYITYATRYFQIAENSTDVTVDWNPELAEKVTA